MTRSGRGATRQDTVTPDPSEEPQPPPPPPPPPSPPLTANGIDLNSRKATRTPEIDFMRPEDHKTPLLVMHCHNAHLTCFKIKEWLLDQFARDFDTDIEATDEEKHKYQKNDEGQRLLRMEHQKIEEIKNSKRGTLLWLEDAAVLRFGKIREPVCILGLLMPHDHFVRWFYSISSFAPLLERLVDIGCISIRKVLEHKFYNPMKTQRYTFPIRDRSNFDPFYKLRYDKHCRIFVFMRETFCKAFAVPDHPDYSNALLVTDYAPEVADPETAYKRFEANDQLYPDGAIGKGRDMADDRYRECGEIDDVEIELASLIDMPISQYLLIKRNFFSAYYYDVMRTEKRLQEVGEDGEEQRGPGTGVATQPKDKKNVVRTDYAHQQYLERHYAMKKSKAKRLVLGWRILGLLEESKMVFWIQNGGMFEGLSLDQGDGARVRVNEDTEMKKSNENDKEVGGEDDEESQELLGEADAPGEVETPERVDEKMEVEMETTKEQDKQIDGGGGLDEDYDDDEDAPGEVETPPPPDVEMGGL